MADLNLEPVGTCGKCGGIVSIPKAWWATTRPPMKCESCGAEAKPVGLPKLEMK